MLAGTAILQLFNGMSGNSLCTSMVFSCKYVLVRDVNKVLRSCCIMSQGCIHSTRHVESCDMLPLMGFSGLPFTCKHTLSVSAYKPEDLRFQMIRVAIMTT